MSFGFAVGDFIAVGTLIANIVDSLRSTRSEYQELLRELEKYVGNSPSFSIAFVNWSNSWSEC